MGKNKRKKTKLVMSTKNSIENSIYKHLVHTGILWIPSQYLFIHFQIKYGPNVPEDTIYRFFSDNKDR